MSLLKRVRNNISPIHTNKGSAVSVQLLLEPQTVTAMASPAGRDEKRVTAIHATPVSVRPTHTPLPRMSNRAISKAAVMSRSFISQSLFAAALDAFAGKLKYQFIKERDSKND